MTEEITKQIPNSPVKFVRNIRNKTIDDIWWLTGIESINFGYLLCQEWEHHPIFIEIDEELCFGKR